MTVRAQPEERRQYRIAIYRQAVELAKTSVGVALDLMEREMIEKYVHIIIGMTDESDSSTLPSLFY
jgi:hypothetical protein